MISIYKQLRRARIKANISQKDIAKKLKVNQSTISRIENGGDISLHHLVMFAIICNKKVLINFK